MGIGRLITIAAVIWLVWFIFTRFQRQLIEKKQSAKNARKETVVSPVKKCDVCGVYVPEHEALLHNGRYYCSEAHKNKSL